MNKLQLGQEEQTAVFLHHLEQREENVANKILRELETYVSENWRRRGADRLPVAVNPVMNTVDQESSTDDPGKATPGKRLCNCFPFEPAPKGKNRPRRRNHREGCIYAFQNRYKRRFCMVVQVFNRQVCLAVNLEYSLMAWTRDWRICPNFTIHATVPDHAEIFEFMKDAKRPISEASTPEKLNEVLQNCLMGLRKFFIEGKSWPTDMTQGGFNLLHVRNLWT